MTTTLKSVQRDATGDPKEVLVTFDIDGKARNILLRDGTDFTVPDSAFTLLASATIATDGRQATMQAAYEKEMQSCAEDMAGAVADFNAIAEGLAVKQMVREDAPIAEPASAADPA